MCGASWVSGMLAAPTSPCCRLSTARKMFATRLAISARRWGFGKNLHIQTLIWFKMNMDIIDQYGYVNMVILVSILVECECVSLMRWNRVTMQVPPEARCILTLMYRASTWLGEAISGSTAWQQLYPAAEWRHFWVETFQLITSIFCLITKTQTSVLHQGLTQINFILFYSSMQLIIY